ncbi:hypothetical protein [Asanoa iriomotensis]|uniref:Uncharacterized protein n=1 Tax=Asanoa iriomotensis TaxID=234613 RepID=A0ABQ4C5L7_9ACTN|nr:hypothetical protein [Asanoa iriomotensis]GIF57716.1 hypothetical protein Air01nite_38110 [Asanoa iriomotensis]
MVSEAQFNADAFVKREVVTPELDGLGDDLCRLTGRPRVAAGTKGDHKHLKGGHRSNEFVRESPLCTNRTYTFQSGLSAEQERHIAAFDFTPGEWGTAANRAIMRKHTARLRAAMLDGSLAGVRQVIGTLDGEEVSATNADGSSFDADDSHLDHWHLTFDRRRCRDKTLMERVIAVALGDEEDDVTPQDVAAIKAAILGDGGMQMLFTRVEALTSGRDPHTGGQPNVLHQRLNTIARAVSQIDADLSVAEQAEVLRKVLGDRAADVGALLAKK